MTDEPVQYRTGALWGVLTVLLLVGVLGSAFFVWGITDALTSGAYLVGLIDLGASAFVTVVVLLLIIGILYRVDRLRGVPHRRVELFD